MSVHKNCPVCQQELSLENGREYEELLVQEHWEKTGDEKFLYGYCSCCHTYMLQDEKALDNLGKYYGGAYYSLNQSFVPLTKAQKKEFLTQYEGPLSTPKEEAIVDLGGGCSVWAYSMVQAGYTDVWVVDPFLTPKNITQLEEAKVKAFKGSIEEWAATCKVRPALVRSNHSLEHMIDPRGTLNAIYSVLKKNGKMELSVPLVGAGFLRYGPQIHCGLDAPRHLWLSCHTGLMIMLYATKFCFLGMSWDANPFYLWSSEAAGKGLCPAMIQEGKPDIKKVFTGAQMLEFAERAKEYALMGVSDGAAYYAVKMEE